MERRHTKANIVTLSDKTRAFIFLVFLQTTSLSWCCYKLSKKGGHIKTNRGGRHFQPHLPGFFLSVFLRPVRRLYKPEEENSNKKVNRRSCKVLLAEPLNLAHSQISFSPARTLEQEEYKKYDLTLGHQSHLLCYVGSQFLTSPRNRMRFRRINVKCSTSSRKVDEDQTSAHVLVLV